MNRLKLQDILEDNPLNCEVVYLERVTTYPDNIIIYNRLPTIPIVADNQIFKNKTTVQISHFHKKKLDTIEQFLNSRLSAYMVNQFKDDEYWHTVYYYHCLIDEGGW